MSRYLISFVNENGEPIEGYLNGSDIQYDNTNSNLESETIQDAIDELDETLDDIDHNGGNNNEGTGYDDSAIVTRINNLEGLVNSLQSTVNSSIGSLAVPVGVGTFQQAFDTSKTNNALFTWLLDDTDDQGRTVKKLIYHISNGEFIDAIGARIVGNLDGLTIVTKGVATIAINSKTAISLHSGINNFTVSGNTLTSDLGTTYSNYLDSGKIKKLLFTGKENILDIDLGGIPIYQESDSNHMFSGSEFSNLRSIRRFNNCGNINQCFLDNTNVQYIQVYGGSSGSPVIHTDKMWVFRNTPNLRYLDLKNWYLKPRELTGYFYKCGAVVYDLRNFDLTECTTLLSLFLDSNIGELIIGDKFIVTKALVGNNGLFNLSTNTCGNIVVTCVSPTPPVPENSSQRVDWLGQAKVLRIPPGSMQSYQQQWPEIFSHSGLSIEEFNEGEYGYYSE